MIHAFGLQEVVHPIGFVADLDEFVDWIFTVDVAVNLRRPTAGETSAVVLRTMAAGRPQIVFDHGWYGELPDDAALKVPPGDEAALLAAMASLAGSADRRQSMGRAALAYVQRLCQPAYVARAYLDFIQTVVTPAESIHG
jgi:hypothetical protein